MLGALAAAALIGMPFGVSMRPAPVAWSELLDRFLVALLFVALGEEPAWRGFLQSMLQRRMNAVRAFLCVAVVWAIWHAPLMGTEFAWESVLLPMLMHASVNTVGAGLVFRWVPEDQFTLFWYIYAAVWAAFAVALTPLYCRQCRGEHRRAVQSQRRLQRTDEPRCHGGTQRLTRAEGVGGLRHEYLLVPVSKGERHLRIFPAHPACLLHRQAQEMPVIRSSVAALAMMTVVAAMPDSSLAAGRGSEAGPNFNRGQGDSVQLGARPFFLVQEMTDSPLKDELLSCSEGPFKRSDFSIGHRGAAMQFPEHTRESYEAAARMGAGIVECDVTFTKDKELVCRHSQNDLHTTTDILVTPLADKCSVPFNPATFDASGNLVAPATAECRTSDITLAEFRTLRGKMDAFNPRAKTPAEYLGGTDNWRTDLYSGPTSGTLMTHRESIELFKQLGVKMTPELKSPSVPMPFNGLTQEAYAQKMIDEYKAADIAPSKVWPQSFDEADVLYWIRHEPAFGKQAVYLDDANVVADLPSAVELARYKAQGINIWAPPLFALLSVNGSNEIVPSRAAMDARGAGLDIIAWTLERSGILADGDNGFYYQTFDAAIDREGDVMAVLDVLARQVRILGVFSDWPATVTYYANCTGLK